MIFEYLLGIRKSNASPLKIVFSVLSRSLGTLHRAKLPSSHQSIPTHSHYSNGGSKGRNAHISRREGRGGIYRGEIVEDKDELIATYRTFGS
jgi:hypothetical protein